MIILDTNILIYLANGDLKIAQYISENCRLRFGISTITVIEYLSFKYLRDKDKKFFLSLINEFDVVNVSLTISIQAAEIKKHYNLKLGDSIIAATTIQADSTLFTRNTADFQKVKKLKLLDL